MRTGSTSDIAAALEASGERRQAVFVVGAGCSVTAGVPLAHEVVDYVRHRYPKACAGAASDSYPDVMHRLTWQSRYALFHGLVRLAGLNWAHVCLAVLMRHGHVGRVLTTNFDDLLLRASALYGLHPSTHDLALTAGAPGQDTRAAGLQYRDALLREPTVLYLHGRHNGFSQMHSPAQLGRQAALLRPVVVAAKQKQRPWVIVGYSAQSDPLFDTLKAGGFPGGLFWVNLRPPEGAALRALRAAGGVFVQADADSFLLDLARRLVGGGRGLMLPALMCPAQAFSTLAAPRSGRSPDLPRPAAFRRVLAAAFEPAPPARAATLAAPAAKQCADLRRDDLLRAIGRGEQLLCKAWAGPRSEMLRFATRADAAFRAAATMTPSRRDVFARWTALLAPAAPETDAVASAEAAAAAWLKEQADYRQARRDEYLLAWATGRAATAAARMAELGGLSQKNLKARRDAAEHLDAGVAASMSLKIGYADLLLFTARQKAAAVGGGAGSELLKKAHHALASACAAAAWCPQSHPRYETVRGLARLRPGPTGHAVSLVATEALRQRIHLASGL